MAVSMDGSRQTYTCWIALFPDIIWCKGQPCTINPHGEIAVKLVKLVKLVKIDVCRLCSKNKVNVKKKVKFTRSNN